MDMMRRRAVMSMDGSLRGLLYRLPGPAVFDASMSAIIDTGTVLLPTDRSLSILADLTPGEMPGAGYMFYAGNHSSPWYWLGLEYRDTTQDWSVGGYSDRLPLTNCQAGRRCRLAIRRSAGSNALTVACYDGTTTVSGTLTVSSISTDPLVLGGYSTSSSELVYKGRIDEFRAYSRRLTDREVSRYLTALPTT